MSLAHKNLAGDVPNEMVDTRYFVYRENEVRLVAQHIYDNRIFY